MSEMNSPQQIVDYVDHAALDKAALPFSRLIVMAMLGGAFIGLGGLLAIVVTGGSVELLASNPGLAKLLFGALFPLGFIAVVLTGADLFTSNCATQVVSLWRKKLNPAQVLRVWSVSYSGNFIGACLAAWAFTHMTQLFPAGQPCTQYLLSVAEHKLANPFMVSFMRGVLANLLVCIATWQGYSAKDTLGRMLGIWFPVMAFVALGMEHSIANMFFIPAAMLAGLDITWAHFFTANLLPVTLGNLVGGALFVGLPYAYIYTRPQKNTAAAKKI
ncbi:formate/nitrite transporter family protein [Iodobacter fluviatilis]|uniref:Formate channel 1 n=1 Tax=Iodobacter fluviatilis TaxID=537 RepID=A0A377SYE9_9NEIS|nr:formate/nitrite transporter family protein [Iodobacter fluviatilis]TCU81149.1 formate/nitrite transporter [Iodobacter fluviatilis]STR46013.1 Formate channel 1 [Iodobacter fluviatilis]